MKSKAKTALDETMIEPLTSGLPSRKSLGDHVFERLRRAIIDGKLPPGSRIIESQLANASGISRTPVREAIHKLDRAGFLKKLPQGGFSVLSLTRDEIKEVFGIRCVLESYAARLAALKHRPEDLKSLEEKLKEFGSCLKRGELEALNKINTEFHDRLYALSRSPKLIKMIGDLKDQIYQFRKILLNDPGTAKMSDEDHRGMIEAIKKREVPKVEKLVREHIQRGQEMVLKKIRHDD
jgi:DNA-binding GntR family transcriptional regulator